MSLVRSILVWQAGVSLSFWKYVVYIVLSYFSGWLDLLRIWPPQLLSRAQFWAGAELCNRMDVGISKVCMGLLQTLTISKERKGP